MDDPEVARTDVDAVILKRGLGGALRAGSTLVLSYRAAVSEAALDADDCFETSDDFDHPIAFHLGASQLNPAVEELLMSASVGDSIRVRLPARLLTGAPGYEKLPPGSSVTVDLNISTKSWDIGEHESLVLLAPIDAAL